MFVVTAAAVLALIAVFRWRYRTPGGSRTALTLGALTAILALFAYAQHDARILPGAAPPTLIAIAVDVSLSMGTAPDPRTHDAGTRLSRIQQTLLPVINELDAAAAPVLIAMTAFTSRSEVILGWDDNLPQIHEALAYVLDTELLTEPGSNLAAGLEGVAPLFEVLPESWREADGAKFLIVASDGERTIDGRSFDTSVAKLRDFGVRILALHVGLADIPEGLPVYDDGGAFVGFDEVGGQFYSTPDPDPMAALAGDEGEQGLLLHAEDDDAAARILSFIGIRPGAASSGPLRVGLVVALWCLTTAVLVRYA